VQWRTSALGHWLACWIFTLGPSNLPTCGSISSLWRHAPGGLGSGIAVLESASWHVGVSLSDCRTAGNILYVPPGNFDDICMSPLGNVTLGNESSALPAAVFWVESVSLLCVHNLVWHCCCYVCSVSLCWSLCQVDLIYWLALSCVPPVGRVAGVGCSVVKQAGCRESSEARGDGATGYGLCWSAAAAAASCRQSRCNLVC
jgi:hypothetical protein